MNKSVGFVVSAIVLSFIILSALPCFASENIYTEDFTTSLYKDAVNTTANWNTVAEELSLFPMEPTIIGNCDTPGSALSVVVAGDYAFVADNESGLQIIDILDPSNPTLIGTYDTPGSARSVVVAGDYAFVADYDYGLHIIDISDPSTPTLIGTCDTPGWAIDVAVAGDYAFVADYHYDLRIIDISDPSNPTLIGHYMLASFAKAVAVSGDYLFLADVIFDQPSGLQIFDISNPSNPTHIGSYNCNINFFDVTVSGDYAFMAHYSGLLIIDISDPAHPIDLGYYDTPGSPADISVSGDYAFVADKWAGLSVIDISDPTNPSLLITCDTPGSAYGVAVAGDHAFVADEYSGLQIIDIADPIPPSPIGSYNTPNFAYGVAVAGDHAFVADYSSGLQIIDISDPTSLTLLGNYNTPSGSFGVTVSGDYAFVADNYSSLQIIDISDPTNPTLLGNYDTPGYARGVTVSGDYAFVADYHSGLTVIDISDPTNPTFLGGYNTPGYAWGVAVSGDYAFIADYSSGLQIIDISDPTSPTLLGNYNTPGNAYGVTVSGDYAFVADASSGLQIIDISSPTSPTLLGTCDTPGSAFKVTVSGDYAFVADYGSGLCVIDISDPTNPTILGSYDTPDFTWDVAVAGDNAFLVDRNTGLLVIKVFEHRFHWDGNVGQSLFVDASSDSIFRARLTTTQTDSVGWELSANGGVNWQGILPDTNWSRTSFPGNDLLWRSTLSWTSPACNPTVTDLQIEWLMAAASIEEIVDVPDDQGGRVKITFTRSGLDFSDETELPISGYGLWRRVDNIALIAAMNSASSPTTGKNVAFYTPDLNGTPLVTYEGNTYVQSGTSFAANSFPPGTWVRLGGVRASNHHTYFATVPTEADSCASGTNHAVFVITAEITTPAIWYVSEPDSGYSIDNIGPAVPTNFVVAYNTGSGNYLSWDLCPDADFKQFNIYRSNDPNFTPLPSDLVHSEIGINWSDPEYDGWDVYYKITALDSADNESGPASPGTVTAAEDPAIPQTYRLYPNVPNPFNPTTSIRYDVPAGGGMVTFHIYDVTGRLIQTVLNGPQTAGQKTVTWNGRDNRGQSVASGVYFYRLRAPGYEKTLRMVLLR